jgi:hypothetical protein
MSIIYLEIKVDPRDTKNDTIRMNIDERGGSEGGNDCITLRDAFIISTKIKLIFSRKSIIKPSMLPFSGR